MKYQRSAIRVRRCFEEVRYDANQILHLAVDEGKTEEEILEKLCINEKQLKTSLKLLTDTEQKIVKQALKSRKVRKPSIQRTTEEIYEDGRKIFELASRGYDLEYVLNKVNLTHAAFQYSLSLMPLDKKEQVLELLKTNNSGSFDPEYDAEKTVKIIQITEAEETEKTVNNCVDDLDSENNLAKVYEVQSHVNDEKEKEPPTLIVKEEKMLVNIKEVAMLLDKYIVFKDNIVSSLKQIPEPIIFIQEYIEEWKELNTSNSNDLIRLILDTKNKIIHESKTSNLKDWENNNYSSNLIQTALDLSDKYTVVLFTHDAFTAVKAKDLGIEFFHYDLDDIT